METAINVFVTSGYCFKILLFFVVSLALCYLHGLFWKKLLKNDWPFFGLFGIGLVSVLAFTEFFGWPFIAYRLSANWFTGIAMAALLIPAAAGALLPGGLVPKEREDKKLPWYILVPAILLLAYLMISSVAALKFNNDDSFYVSNVALFAVSDNMNPFDSSMGDVTTATVPMYDFQIWEGLMSVPCRLFGLNGAEVMHTLIVPVIIFCAASGFFFLGDALFRDRKKAAVFLGVILLFMLCSRYHYDSPESFLLRRTWQGKTVNVNVVLPVLAALLIGHYEGKEKKASLTLLLCVTAGMAVNPTSLYINGFLIVFLSVSLALWTKAYKKGLDLIPAVIATVAFTLLLYFRTKACAGKIESAGIVEDGFWLNTLQDVFGDNLRSVILFGIAFLYTMIFGDRKVRYCFGLPCLLMAVFLWNPWTGRFVAEKITKEPTYWRVFWLVPMGPVIAWAAVHLLFRPKQAWITATATGVMAAALVLCGNWSVAPEYTPNPENLEEIYLDIGLYAEDNGIRTPILAHLNVATRLRQQFTDLWLLVAKRHYVEDVYLYFGREEEGNDRLRLFDFANQRLKQEELEGIDELLRKYEVDCVILSKSSKREIQYLEEKGYTLDGQAGKYLIYRRPKGNDA